MATPNGRTATERVVILKADGLPYDTLDSVVRARNPQTGKSVLPWIDYVFYQRGVRLRNFYSRGLSLSAPSWALLDSGQPGIIKGNLEFDRLTLRSYDYLNLFARVLRRATGKEIGTPAIEVMDEQRTPVLSDAYAVSERNVGAQVLTRVLPNSVQNMKRLLTLQGPKEWLDEWTIGFDQTSFVFEILEHDLIENLKKSEVRYIDFMIPAYDHIVHVNRAPEASLRALQEIDRVVGEAWTAIEKGPLAGRTALILVSDHGMNTDSRVYSQGYNLVDLFTSAAGGGHHVVTNRPPLGDYSLRSLSPVISAVTTAAPASFYLKDQADKYPTLLLDADGNERASIYMRDSNLNLLQILWQQMSRRDLRPELERAARSAFFTILDRNRPQWTALVDQLSEELEDLKVRIAATERSAPKKRSAAFEQAFSEMKEDQKAYGTYLIRLRKLLELRPETFNPSRLKVEDVIPPKSMGQLNSIHSLQNYAAGPSRNGLALNGDGSLDMSRSFTFVNYFELLSQIRTRNNVQQTVAASPVDFVAAAVPVDNLSSLADDRQPVEIAVWLYSDEARQLLVLARHNSKGMLELRCLPVQGLTQAVTGAVTFSIAPWGAGFPLQLWEGLAMPEDAKQTWLNSWREEREWLEATHAMYYSHAVVSLYEQFAFATNPNAGGTGPDAAMFTRFRNRKRLLIEPDFIIFASDHWNFNYRDFNPGGNHGAFFRKSTQATLMLAGGAETGIPRGLIVDRPYDTLSFVPTVFTLTGDITDTLSPRLTDKGFRPFPGEVIRELFELQK
jgi:hypothetical protein